MTDADHADGFVPSGTIDQILGLSGRGGIPAGIADPDISDLLTAPIDPALTGPARRAELDRIILAVARGAPIRPALLHRLALRLDSHALFTIGGTAHETIGLLGLSPARVLALSLALPNASFRLASDRVALSLGDEHVEPSRPDAETGTLSIRIELGNTLSIVDDDLFVVGAMPGTVLLGIAGRWLADVVSHPVLDPQPLRIAAASEEGPGLLRIRLQPRRRIFLRSLVEALQ